MMSIPSSRQVWRARSQITRSRARLDEKQPAGRITDRLLSELRDADLCVADLSGCKANVMWEVGYAMALDKPTIFITQQVRELPFDVKDMQSIPYDRAHLKNTLDLPLRKMVMDTMKKPNSLKRSKLTWLDSSDAVYKSARQMVQECRNDEYIRATDLLPYHGDKEFDEYFASIVRKMQEAKVTYRLVAAVEADEGPGTKGLQERHRLIRQTAPEALDKMDAKCVAWTFPLEVLIVGDRVLLGFPCLAPKDRRVTRGILVEDQKVSDQFIDWYDYLHLREARDWEEPTEKGA